MKTHLPAGPLDLLAPALIAVTLAVTALRAADGPPVVAKPNVNAAVTVTDDGRTWTMDNGIVKATIDKGSGNMTSLIYRGINTMGPGGIWEQKPSGKVTQSLTIDPEKNGGARAEVDVKGVNGRMDIEVRYALERGVSGIYAYAIFSHAANYPAAGEGESRYITKLNSSSLIGSPWTQTATCSNAPRRTGARASSSTRRSSGF